MRPEPKPWKPREDVQQENKTITRAQTASRQDLQKEKKSMTRAEIVSVVISVASFLVAVAAWWMSYEANEISQSGARVTVYSELRKTNAAIREKIADQYFMVNADAPKKQDDVKQWNAIRDYWYSSFDEWYVTNKLYNETFKTLWQERYVYLIGASLEKRAFREVACAEIVIPTLGRAAQSQIKNPPSSPLFQEYVSILAALYVKHPERKPGEQLCP